MLEEEKEFSIAQLSLFLVADIGQRNQNCQARKIGIYQGGVAYRYGDKAEFDAARPHEPNRPNITLESPYRRASADARGISVVQSAGGEW